MQTIEKTIVIERPAIAVYDQWARFQFFPQFMTGIKEVRRLDEKHQHWKTVIGGTVLEWEAEIIERVIDQRIVWRSTGGAENSGSVTFIALSPARTRVLIYLAYVLNGILENLGNNLGLVSARVAGDLNRFKGFVESRVVSVHGGRTAGMTVPAGI